MTEPTADPIIGVLHNLVGATAISRVVADSGAYTLIFRVPKDRLGVWRDSILRPLVGAGGGVITRVDLSEYYYDKGGSIVWNWRLVLRYDHRLSLEYVAEALSDSIRNFAGEPKPVASSTPRLELDDVALVLRRFVGATPAIEPKEIPGAYSLLFRVPKESTVKWEMRVMPAIIRMVDVVVSVSDVSRSYYEKGGVVVRNWRLILRFPEDVSLEDVGVHLLETVRSAMFKHIEPPELDSPEGAVVPLYGIHPHRFGNEVSRPGPASTQIEGAGVGVRQIRWKDGY